ncbi:SIS domain-containing protein [Candidatus Sumerlaeota bacterium]|nr:SIS domain-containing protein [Candidatus Sumerlaeota bacterium]
MKTEIEKQIKEHIECIQLLGAPFIRDIEKLAKLIIKTLKCGKKLILFGNGGSAADAQHFACELVGTFLNHKRRGLPAIALSTNTSSLTSIGNDFSFDMVFQRQIEALAQAKDLCIGISTSGNSKNVYEALVYAAKRGLPTAAFLGCNGGKIKGVVDSPLVIPSNSTPRIQEAHVMIIHILCTFVDQAFS